MTGLIPEASVLLRDAQQDIAAELRQQVENGARLAGIRARLVEVKGDAYTEISRVCTEVLADAVVVGAGPNGLAAAVTLARAGLSVEVVERNDTIGGGARTAELTLPGFLHDVCSAVHPMALQSEFFRRFRMEDRIELRLPEVQYGHPLDHGRAGIMTNREAARRPLADQRRPSLPRLALRVRGAEGRRQLQL
jgi:hypothetical protein